VEEDITPRNAPSKPFPANWMALKVVQLEGISPTIHLTLHCGCLRLLFLLGDIKRRDEETKTENKPTTR